MKQLSETIDSPEKRKAVIDDCVQLVESEVKSKRGLSGAAVKAAFAVVRALKPTIFHESVDSLLNDFISQLQPFVVQAAGQNAPSLEKYLPGQAAAVAESLLGITDARAQRASNKTLVKAYKKLRPKGKAHVMAAVPGIGRVLDKHV